ncbi:hypothetical protein ACNOYE_24315 [Nannocystaceae bacterium ST9]
MNDPPASNQLVRFRLDFRSAGGHVMAQDGTQAIHEWTSWLRVRSDERVAELVLTRHNGDMVERPVGRFRQTLDDAGLLALQQAIVATKWAELPEPQIGDPTANWLTFEYVAGETVIRREFSASAQAFMTAISPLLLVLNAAMSAPLAGPLAAIAVVAEAARAKPGKPVILTMRLRNLGTEPVVITDPRVPASGDAGPRARLLVAAKPGEMHMPSWTAIDLDPLPAGSPEVRVLEAGGELELATSWTPTLKGACLLQAVWQDYAGPIRAAPDQLGFFPLPEAGPSAAGPYPVRGAAFSSYASFDA